MAFHKDWCQAHPCHVMADAWVIEEVLERHAREEAWNSQGWRPTEGKFLSYSFPKSSKSVHRLLVLPRLVVHTLVTVATWVNPCPPCLCQQFLSPALTSTHFLLANTWSSKRPCCLSFPPLHLLIHFYHWDCLAQCYFYSIPWEIVWIKAWGQANENS